MRAIAKEEPEWRRAKCCEHRIDFALFVASTLRTLCHGFRKPSNPSTCLGTTTVKVFGADILVQFASLQ